MKVTCTFTKHLRKQDSQQYHTIQRNNNNNTCLMALFQEYPGEWTAKVKPIWIYWSKR